MKTAIAFPGQGSQRLGMLRDLAANFRSVVVAFEEASDVIGVDLWKIAQSDEINLGRTEFTQPILLAAGWAVWKILENEKGVEAEVFAGHSLGEYTAYTAAGMFDFGDAVRLIHQRGLLMQQAVPLGEGTMAAVIGCDYGVVAAVCNEVADGQIVAPANHNAPDQVVISGRSDAVERARVRLQKKGARFVPLAVSVPSHCELMSGAAYRLSEHLRQMAVRDFSVGVISNARNCLVCSTEDALAALCEQLCQPVRWVENVQLMATLGIGRVVECGPSSVLTSLNRKIDKTLKLFSVNDNKSLEKL